MKRRDFLKNLGTGAAIAATYPLLSRTGTEAVEPAPERPYNPYMEDDSSRWGTVANAVDDNLFMYEMDYEPGEYTKKLTSLMKKVMKEQGDRPATHDLRDVYISPEAMEDIRNWGVDEVDEQTRKEILGDVSVGRRGPYFRYANFPVEITTKIEVAKDGLVPTSVGYEFPVGGPFTEEITMIGNVKSWNPSSDEFKEKDIWKEKANA